MDPDTFLATVRKSTTSAGCDLERNGFAMTVDNGRWRISRPRSIYENDGMAVSGTRLDEGSAAQAAKSIRSWWSAERHRQAIIGAHDWLYGARDDVRRPYMVDALIMRRFELAGIDVDGVADLMRAQIGPRPGVGQILQRLGHTYSSFHNSQAPAGFDYRWRSGLTPLRPEFAAAGPIQFKLGGNGGCGMWAYFTIAPGAFYCGGPSPAIWLTDPRVQGLPETMLLAYRERPVVRMIEHPALDIGLVISSVRREAGRLTVGLRALRTDLAAPRLAKAA